MSWEAVDFRATFPFFRAATNRDRTATNHDDALLQIEPDHLETALPQIETLIEINI